APTGRSGTPCRSAPRPRPAAPSRSRPGRRTCRAPTRARGTAPAPRTRPRARRPRARRTAPRSRRYLLLLSSRRGRAPGQLRQLRVARALRERGERLPRLAPLQPSGDQPLHRRVELRRGHAPEQRPTDRRLGTERAAQVDLVRLLAPPLLVPQRRPLEAEVADPVLGARVRAAVEVEPQLGDLLAEAALQVLDQRAQPRLRLRHREVAVRLARARDRRAAHAVRIQLEARQRERVERPLDAL